MDERDLEILEFLRRDGRIPYTEIAKEMGVAEGTIRNRVAKLQEGQTLQIIGLADPRRLGYDAPAIIGVSVQPPLLEEVAEQIALLPEVSYLILVAGEYDLMVEVMCRDREALATFLREKLQQIEGVTRTETFMILHTYKMAMGAKPVATRDGQLEGISGKNDG